MNRIDWPSTLGRLAVLTLLALAAWFRLSSLEAMPEHIGDESIYGVALARWLNGRGASFWTPTGHLLSPFYAAMQLPLIALGKPALWMLRAPAAVSGLLAVALAYGLWSKVLGRTTAASAALLLACLPGTIIISRIGNEISQIPVVGVIGLYFAFRANGPALLATFLAGLLVHPTCVLYLPVLLTVYLARALMDASGDRRKQLRIVAVAGAVTATILVAFVINTGDSPARRAYHVRHRATPDWPHFVVTIGRFLSGASFYTFMPTLQPEPPISTTVVRSHEAAFWLLLAGACGLGLRHLIRRRRWDHLALLAGLAASLAGLHVTLGPDPLWSRSWRYGAFLIAPAALGFAVLVHAVAEEARLARRLRVGAVLATCAFMLISVKCNYFDVFSGESVWTFRADARDPHRRAVTLIRRDLDRSKPRTTVIGGEHWTFKPQEFLNSDRDSIDVEWFERLGADHGGNLAGLYRKLDAGAYAVTFPDGTVDQAVPKMFPAEMVRRWDIPDVRGRRYLTVYRLKRPGEPERLAGSNNARLR